MLSPGRQPQRASRSTRRAAGAPNGEVPGCLCVCALVAPTRRARQGAHGRRRAHGRRSEQGKGPRSTAGHLPERSGAVWSQVERRRQQPRPRRRAVESCDSVRAARLERQRRALRVSPGRRRGRTGRARGRAGPGGGSEQRSAPGPHPHRRRGSRRTEQVGELRPPGAPGSGAGGEARPGLPAPCPDTPLPSAPGPCPAGTARRISAGLSSSREPRAPPGVLGEPLGGPVPAAGRCQVCHSAEL